MSKIYSQRHLGLFSSPLFTIDDHGFEFKGKRYTIDDVKSTRVVSAWGNVHLLGIILKDGKRILINASVLELNGNKTKSQFLSGRNEEFDSLVAYFSNKKTKEINSYLLHQSQNTRMDSPIKFKLSTHNKLLRIFSILFRIAILVPAFILALAAAIEHHLLEAIWFGSISLFCTTNARTFKKRMKINYYLALFLITTASLIVLNYLLKIGYIVT